MIEEPKELGPYWIQPVTGGPGLIYRTSRGWVLPLIPEISHPLSVFAHTIITIEPVTPPSWERKP